MNQQAVSMNITRWLVVIGIVLTLLLAGVAFNRFNHPHALSGPAMAVDDFGDCHLLDIRLPVCLNPDEDDFGDRAV